MRILLIEPFFSGSHRKWAEGLQKYSSCEVKLLTLPGRHWKWRMAGGAVALAEEFLQSDFVPALILATDMLDLATFLALSRKKSAGIPTAVYFHENQITYPWSPTDSDIRLKRDHHYGFINYTSALTADRLFFNSDFHRKSFLEALPKFLKMFPDRNDLHNVKQIIDKSETLHLGMDLQPFFNNSFSESSSPVLLWNHRHEYDKDPDTFFETLFKLDAQQIDFQLIVLGESYKKSPPVFAKAKEKLAHKILHWGYTSGFDTYCKLIQQADILPVTNRQDFFGGSIVEAIAGGCIPLLPDRLAYPEHIPERYRNQFLYHNENDFFEKLKSIISNLKKLQETVPVRNFVERYDWSTFAPIYDKKLYFFNSSRAESDQFLK